MIDLTKNPDKMSERELRQEVKHLRKANHLLTAVAEAANVYMETKDPEATLATLIRALAKQTTVGTHGTNK